MTLRQSKRNDITRRIIVERPGGPETLRFISTTRPEPGPREYLVRILVAGISYADLLMREGVHPETPRTPFTPGWDIIGVIEEVGSCSLTLRPGIRVAALPIVGGYAETICLPEAEIFPIPEEVDPCQAVSLVLNYMTAYQMLHRVARVTPGQKVLVHAAAGGVGTALLQLGQLAELKIYATASSRNHDIVARHGGIAIDYQSVDFVERLHTLESGGLDFVFDGIGGAHLWRSYRVLRSGGSVIAYGFTSSLSHGKLSKSRPHRLQGLFGYLSTIAAAKAVPDSKNMRIYSIQRLKRCKPVWFREDLSYLMELLVERRIVPILAAKLPLEKAAQAHWLLAHGVRGKIVLNCDGGKR